MNRLLISKIFFVVLTFSAVAFQVGSVSAQVPSSSPPAIPSQPPTSGTPTQTSVSDESAAKVTSPPVLYGLQGVLVETLDGKTVAAQSEDTTFNPASAVKLGTALISLRTFGANHRFTTGIWTNGTFDKTTGTITGNIYVSGRDPSFHYEHAVMIARQLNSLGILTVSGDLVISPGFTMNFNGSPRRSGEQLYNTLDSTLRSGEATRSWFYERSIVGDKKSLQSVPGVAVLGEVQVNTVAPDAKLLLSHRSSRLVDILKVLLCYSNNFMAERLGDTAGGTQSVERQLTSSLKIAEGELRLSSLSGLGVNRVTPRAMMKILRALREELRNNKLTMTDILPVAGVDPGTLEDRYVDPARRGSVIAKTGTLIRTDGGVSSLVGQLRTASSDTLLFVIMNQRGSVKRFRTNQDFLVTQIQDSRGGAKPFAYKPHMLAMKLSDTEHTFNSTTDEFEPRLKGSAAP